MIRHLLTTLLLASLALAEQKETVKRAIDDGEVTQTLDFTGTVTRNGDAIPGIVSDTSDPDANDDSDDGYEVGTRWINTSSGSTFTCSDATVGAANWVSESGSGGDVSGPSGGVVDGEIAVYSGTTGKTLQGSSGLQFPLSSGAIATDAVTTAKIQADAVTASEIAADAVGSSEIATDAVGADEIAAGAVGSGEIAAGAVGASALTTDAVTLVKMADDSVGADEIVNNSITAAELATGSVDSDEIASGAVDSDEIATDAVGSAEIATDAVDSDEIAAGAVLEAEVGYRFPTLLVFGAATDTAAGDAAGGVFIPIPHNLTGSWDITYVEVIVYTAGTTGTLDVQIARGRGDTRTFVDVLSTVVTVDTGEVSSDDAATPYVINTANDDLAAGDVLRIDVDAVHSGTAAQGMAVIVGITRQ